MKKEIEELKRKLYKAIEAYGRDSPEVLRISQELDSYIVKEMENQKSDLKIKINKSN